MANHDKYGKDVLRAAAGSDFLSESPYIDIDYGAGFPARIDGTIANRISVEIESRVSKQVRGAILDLICHPYPQKLLVLLPVHMSNPDITLFQCKNILSRFVKIDDFRVVLATGHGGNQKIDVDASLVRNAIEELGIQSTA
jgi:hypothetical protein